MDRRANRWLSDLPLWLAGGSALLFLVSISAALLVAEADVDAASSADAPGGAQAAYELRLDPAGGVVRLRGLIDFGVTRDLETLLLAAPQARVIRLESAGGRLAEARGLARLVRRMALDTSASGECSSACTLVLLSGRTRYLEPGADGSAFTSMVCTRRCCGCSSIRQPSRRATRRCSRITTSIPPSWPGSPRCRIARCGSRGRTQLLAAGAVDVLGRPDTSPLGLSDRAGSPLPR